MRFYTFIFGIIHAMKTATKPLSNNVKKLQVLLARKDTLLSEKDLEIKKLQEKNQYLLEQFRLAQQNRFGKSSEKSPEQGELFNEAEQTVDEAIEPEKEKISYTRNKPKRKPLPKDLPRETVVIDLADEEKTVTVAGMTYTKWVKRKANNLNSFPHKLK